MFPGWRARAEDVCDSPPWAVVKMADRLGADLVVVGARRHAVAGGRLNLGSTSRRVLYESHCTVRAARCAGERRGGPVAMTMTFVSPVLIRFFRAYNFRSDRHSVLRRPFANKWLNIAIVWELILLGLILYVPFLERVFGTFELTARDWLIVVAAALTVSPVLELAKWTERRGWLGEVS